MLISDAVDTAFKTEWNEFVQNHKQNTVFQFPVMYDFYQKVDGYDPFLFYTKSATGNLSAILLAVTIREKGFLKGFFSKRAVIYGGPIIRNDKKHNKNLDYLLKKLVKVLAPKTVFIQFRNFFQWDEKAKEIFAHNGFIYKDRLNLLVDTSSKSVFEKGLSKSRSRQIRKGLESNVEIVDPQSEKDILELYHNLKILYKEKIKKPLPDLSFFKVFYEMSLNRKQGIIKLVKKDKKIIGGIVCPVTQDKCIYEWYVFGLDKEFKKSYPSVLATWAPIDYAIENKIPCFDFMGMGLPGVKYGVRDFKLRFGGNTVNYGRFSRRNKLLYPVVEMAYNILRFYGLHI